MGLYIVTFMLRRSWIPEALRVKNFKRFMRTLLTLWMLIILLGLEIYYFYYLEIGRASCRERVYVLV